MLQVIDRRETVDYLVIETSGAADPRPVAATLAQLCRLDLVVTVVDGTAAAEHDQIPLFHHQLTAADLVLLNKNDLLNEDATEAAEGIIARATTAKIVRTSHGQVPLDLLMDLQVQTRSKGADTADGFLSHDGTCSDIIYSVGGRPHFHDKSRHMGFELHTSHSDASWAHARKDGPARTRDSAVGPRSLVTLALTCSDAPVSFSAFEVFVSRLANSGESDSAQAGNGGWGRIWRAKGFVWCAEARKVMYEFHLSGARRVDLTEEGAWSGEPKTQIVIIGENVDADGIQLALQECQRLDGPLGDVGGAGKKAADDSGNDGMTCDVDVLALIHSDPNFEVWPSEETGVQERGADGREAAHGDAVLVSLKESDEMRLHGVYARHLNREVVSAVNARRAPLLLLPVTPPGAACLHMMFVLSRNGGAVERWGIVRDTAYKILESKCIARCKCGF